MDFRRKNRRRPERKLEFDDGESGILESQYPHNIALYRLPPTDNIKMQEFEDLALERLKMLGILEQANLKSMHFLSDEWKDYVTAELTSEGLKEYLRLFGVGGSSIDVPREIVLQARRRDYISHFILRLAFCRSQDLQRWFICREMEVFKYKFSTLTSTEIKDLLNILNLDYIQLSQEQKNEIKDGLCASTTGQSVSEIDLLDFYKVPFTHVYDLVSSRRCYLKDSFAYVSSHDFVSIVAAKHQREIEIGLQSAQTLIRDIEVDDRIIHLFKSLDISHTGKGYTLSKDGSVPIGMLDPLLKKSFPLCMRVCHEHLRATHHHRHMGRMQYGLFLKTIGVTLEDSIRFWREEFTKKMTHEVFAKKQYEYSINHYYGKKGSMIDYPAYSCQKIISENISNGEVHGCPYKIFDHSTLEEKLINNGLSTAHVQEVMGYASKGHYQLACGKYFDITHNSMAEICINHPNQYFKESQILLGNRESKPDKSADLLEGSEDSDDK